MKTLIYIGNRSGVKTGANLSSIDVLSTLFTENGFNVYTASNKKNVIYRLIDMLWVCFKYRKEAHYVLIDTYSTLNFYYAYFVSQLCRVFKLKYIPILHGGNLPNRLKKSVTLSKAIFKNAYINIAPSLYTESNFKAYGYKNISCIPNAIEINNYPFKERTFDDVRLLWVRSFSKIYNPLLAINILKALEDQNIKASLCMVGPDSDGSLKEAKIYANKIGVNVCFTGKLPKKEWIELSKGYNVFINTTNFDNMPVSVIEAMALGLPIVSTNVGGLPYLIEHNKTGMLVKPNAVNDFVNIIKMFMDSSNHTNQMIKEARSQVENLNWDIVKAQWHKVLK